MAQQAARLACVVTSGTLEPSAPHGDREALEPEKHEPIAKLRDRRAFVRT